MPPALPVPPALSVRLATGDDADAVATLVHSAYRSDESRIGWTTEADLIGGQRTDAAMVRELILSPTSVVLVAEARGGHGDGHGARHGDRQVAAEDLLACCLLEHRGESAYLGMFAVRPGLQGQGVGRSVLRAAEDFAATRWGATTLELTVLDRRPELAAWYERCGFALTGVEHAFPYGDERFGLPRHPDLVLLEMSKGLPAHTGHLREDGPMSEHHHTAIPVQVPRTAVVTGAGRGIGRALALGLAAEGYDVALVGRTQSHLDAVAAEIAAQASGIARSSGIALSGASPRTLVVAVDLVDGAAVRAAVARIEAELGPVGLLVNNAGVVEHREVPFAQDDPEDSWRVIETNVRGPLLVTHALLPGMLAQGGGRVVNINSGAGHRGTSTYTGYAISKGALARLTTELDTQYREHGLRVFDLAPGVVATDMTAGMPAHDGRTDWTPVEAALGLVLAVGAGDLDALSGRFLRAGDDTPEELAARAYDILVSDARTLRLVRYGPTDPLVPTAPSPGAPPAH